MLINIEAQLNVARLSEFHSKRKWKSSWRVLQVQELLEIS